MPELLTFLLTQPLLLLAIAGIFVVVLGNMLRRASPGLSGFLRGVGNLSLVAALLLTVAQAARLNPDGDFALVQIGQPKQVVSGKETRVPMARDGHFWITARVNGVERRFLVDTGATLTAVSPQTAARAEVTEQAYAGPVRLNTANGTVTAQLATISELRFGNVVARDLDAVIAPGMGDTNVIGMNLLSRLASWRVEGRTLVLVPKHPQPPAVD